MSIFSPHFLIACAGLLLVSCSHPTPSPSGARLSQAEAIRISADAATKRGYRLADYDPPQVHYEFTRKDQTWTIFYEGKVRLPGHHFLVSVDDRTRESRVMPRE